eukprot:snap_masked-scaffold_14-processed-gene-8.26-mRNA-1 protein AED:1.00 eAED:1.00 QI:0/-1/0/0/-1/1/1/0/252
MEEHKYENRKIQTTQWEDILVKKNVIPEREEVKAQREIEKEIKNRDFITYNKPEETLSQKLNQVKLDEDLDYIADKADDRELELFIENRKKELYQREKLNKYGKVREISRDEFVKEVAEASEKSLDESNGEVGQWVIVEVYRNGIERSALLTQVVRSLSNQEPTVKFVRIKDTSCAENWRAEHTPALLLYFGGKLQHTIIDKQLQMNSLKKQLMGYGIFEERKRTVGQMNSKLEEQSEQEDRSDVEESDDDW